MNGRWVEEVVVTVVLMTIFAIAVGCCVTGLTGCAGASQKAEYAAIATAYGLSLDRCKATGKASGSFAVFEACEKAEARRLCNERPQLRTAWARCADVGVTP